MTIKEILQFALEHHQTGKFKQAEQSYKKVLKKHSNNFDALHMLGVLYSQIGNHSAAIQYIGKALKFNPNSFYANFNLGNVFSELKKYDKAIEYYQKAIQLKTDYSDAYYSLGNTFEHLGQLQKAIESYQKVLFIDPYNVHANYNIGSILQKRGHLDKALLYFQNVIKLDPNFAGAYHNLGFLFQKKGKLDEAINYYNKAIQINPNYSTAYSNLGAIIKDKGHLDESIPYFMKALQIEPTNADSYNNLGNVFKEKGDIHQALQYYQKAIKLKPNLAEAHFNTGCLLLLSGDFAHGWEEYEWRWQLDDFRKCNFTQPLWDGTSLTGKKIFIYTEQGIGDEIMFVSCLPEIIAQTGSCIVECEKRLIPLFTRSFPRTIFVEKQIQYEQMPPEILSADMRISIGSLPKYFRTSLNIFSQQKAYLIPDKKLVEIWKQRFDDLGSGLKVGISWRGGKYHLAKLARSTVLSHWKDLFFVPGVDFINLQYGDCTYELKEAWENLDITIHDWEDANPLKDLDNFAAQIAALDLIISVDNATVHMAGALGRQVWTLLPFITDWRWMLNRDDSPWYPTMKLFRQPSVGDWKSVIDKIKDELLKLLSKN
jgi:tetratricopeptide (TPR) repeat protein